MQDTGKIKPEFLNLDGAYENLQPNETPFAKNIDTSINGNPDLGIGTDNGTGEGQNANL